MQRGITKTVKIGCCGFAQSRKKYFEEFPVVEIQQTFYQLPRLETVERWWREAPDGFEFTLKAWQLITHKPASPTYRKLKENIPAEKISCYGSFQPTSEVFEAWRRTLEIASILKAKIVIFQSPPSFQPVEINKQNMREFFYIVDRNELIFCWEPRGTWKAEEIKELCTELNLVHCVDPFTRDTTYGSIRYYRLHGIGGYRYKYTEDNFAALEQKCPDDTVTYVMFNNVSMWEDAHRFQNRFELK